MICSVSRQQFFFFQIFVRFFLASRNRNGTTKPFAQSVVTVPFKLTVLSVPCAIDGLTLALGSNTALYLLAPTPNCPNRPYRPNRPNQNEIGMQSLQKWQAITSECQLKELEHRLLEWHRYFDGNETEDNWQIREKALLCYRSWISSDIPWSQKTRGGWKQIFFPLILDDCRVSMKSLRTTLCTQALTCLQELYRLNVGLCFYDTSQLSEPVISDLLKLMAACKKISVQNAVKTFCTVLQSVLPSRKLVSLLYRQVNDKSVSVRFNVIVGFEQLLLSWAQSPGPMRKVFKNSMALELLIDNVERILKKSLYDANPQVRDVARELWWCLNDYSQAHASKVYDALDANVKKLVMKHQTLSPRPSHLQSLDELLVEISPITEPLTVTASSAESLSETLEIVSSAEALSASAEVEAPQIPLTKADVHRNEQPLASSEFTGDDRIKNSPPTLLSADSKIDLTDTMPERANIQLDTLDATSSAGFNFEEKLPSSTAPAISPLKKRPGNDITPSKMARVTEADSWLNSIGSGSADPSVYRKAIKYLKNDLATGSRVSPIDVCRSVLEGLPKYHTSPQFKTTSDVKRFKIVEYAALILQVSLEKALAAVFSESQTLLRDLVDVLCDPKFRVTDWASSIMDATLESVTSSNLVADKTLLLPLFSQKLELLVQSLPASRNNASPPPSILGEEALPRNCMMAARLATLIGKMLRRQWPMPHNPYFELSDSASNVLQLYFDALTQSVRLLLQSQYTELRKAAIDLSLGLFHVSRPIDWELFYGTLSLAQQKLFQVYKLRTMKQAFKS